MIHRTVTRPSPYCECDRCPSCGKPVPQRATPMPGTPAGPMPCPNPYAPYWSIYPPYTISYTNGNGPALGGTTASGFFMLDRDAQ